MITYTVAKTPDDLLGILELQKINLPSNLSPEEIKSEGFVTLKHSLSLLEKMNAIEPHVIAKDGEKVVAYLLAMTTAARWEFPELFPMFETFDTVRFKGKKISEYKYIVVGQACVAKEYRGQSVMDNCYQAYKNQFSRSYDFAVTDVATSNPRSIKAHQRVGFQEVHRYSVPGSKEWSIILWDWS